MDTKCKHPENEIDWSPFTKDNRFFIFKCIKCDTVVGFATNPNSIGHSNPEPQTTQRRLSR